MHTVLELIKYFNDEREGIIVGFLESITNNMKESYEKSVALQNHRKECEKDLSTFLVVTFGFRELNLMQQVTMRQKANGNVYFNYDSDVEYRIIGYEWNGPIYDQIVTSNTQGISTTKKNGKAGKMTAGAVVGGMVAGPAGLLVGTAIGAGGKSKSNTQNTSNTRQVSTQTEKMSTAIIKLKRITDETIHSITVNCNSSIDSKIRCFNMDENKNATELSQDITSSLEAIKALKQLLDLGAITQEEYELKKNQFLNI